MLKLTPARVMVSLAISVGLLVSSVARADVVQISSLIGVPNPALVGQPVDFTEDISLSSPNAATKITITSITNYMFDFGDGITTGLLNDGGPFPNGTAINPARAFEGARHTYIVPGTYTVRFTGTVNYTFAGTDPSFSIETSFPETVLPTPEPATLIAAAFGLAGLCLLRRRAT